MPKDITPPPVVNPAPAVADDSARIQEVEQKWADRRIAMGKHRKQFEPIWESGIKKFFQGILSSAGVAGNKLYDAIYEQYDMSMFSREGLRFNDLKYPLLHTIALRAMASEFKNRPAAKFTAIGSNDPSKAIAFTHLFNQVLAECDADQEDFEVMLDRRIRGTGAVLQLTEKREVTVKDPTSDKDGELKYTKKTKKMFEVGYKKIDLRHLYLDEHCRKSNLKDCRYAQVDEFIGKEDFVDRFRHLGAEKLTEIVAQQGEVGDNPFVDESQNHYIRITHCFDVLEDCYDLLAFGKKINEFDEPIPRIAGRRGKAIPIALAPMYKIPDCPFGYGDAHIISAFNSIKDLARLMIFELTQKSAKKTLFIDPNSTFDENGFEWGQDFARVAPGDVKEMEINPDLDILYKMDGQTDNDVIKATGININDTTNADTSETARKTVIRRESQNAIIELGMDYLGIAFYKRLYNLMKDDVRLHYTAALKRGEEISVKTEGVKLTRGKKGALNEYGVTGWRYFDLKAGDVDMDMEVVLEIGNIAVSEQLMKALRLEAAETIAKVAPQGVSQEGLAKYIQEESDMPDYVLLNKEGNMENAKPEDIANEGLDPSFLPESQKVQPNQQANAQTLPPLPPTQGAGAAAMPVEQAPAAGNSSAGAIVR